MNLVVDFGNTRIKTARFNGPELIVNKTFGTIEALLNDTAIYQNAQNIIVASVTDKHPLFIRSLNKNQNCLLFEANTPIPIKNTYKSAATLGSDRIAASIGAFSLYPNQNVLTVDAGTCIKYNFVNANNEFVGGAISPGIDMRLKAMSHFTSRLPLINADFNYEKLTGTNTQESLLSGALIGAALEVESMIERYLNTYKNLQIVITGGNAEYLCKQLKNRFFAQPNLVLYGLNTILNYNIEK
jgi:type III pantothenate kinase